MVIYPTETRPENQKKVNQWLTAHIPFILEKNKDLRIPYIDERSKKVHKTKQSKVRTVHTLTKDKQAQQQKKTTTMTSRIHNH